MSLSEQREMDFILKVKNALDDRDRYKIHYKYWKRRCGAAEDVVASILCHWDEDEQFEAQKKWSKIKEEKIK